ncbi:MAG: FAD-binding oxidoreductase [Candidatus Binataceae bacterium]|nr:FAD-binding oxidoreductase [Candidatus Binataceae bacterium]
MPPAHETDRRDPALRVASELGAQVSAERLRTPEGLEALAADLIVEPINADELSNIVFKCEADGIQLAPIGAARSLSQMRKRPVTLGVSLARMARIIAYEPDDMTITAEAGVTLGALNQQMLPHRQHLPLDPADPGSITLGSLIGAAKAGPLRLSEGTPRDLLIGVRFVGHGGRVVHGGGQVVKNVAGYDLMKVMTGSYGTLGIVFEATFKVRPIPERCTIARLTYNNPSSAFEAAARLHNGLPLVHLEVVSPAVARTLGLAQDHFALAAGFCGNREEIEYQTAQIRELADSIDCEIVQLASALRIYRRLRDFSFTPPGIAAQIATPPASLMRCLQDCGVEFRAHAGSGVAQIFHPGEPNLEEARAIVERWRKIATDARGHLRAIFAPASMRDSLDRFGAPSAGVLQLSRRLKTAFDPAGIFNPDCFVGGL